MTQRSYCNLNPNILRPHRIVRKQYQTPFQIFKSHIGRVLFFPTNIETNGKISKVGVNFNPIELRNNIL